MDKENRSEIKLTSKQIAGYIDHTLLKPEATANDIGRLCEEALKYNFAAVCVNPSYVKTCSQLLGGSEVKVCTVVGFPLGATTTEIKAAETIQAIQNGAAEIDMVINIGRLKDGDKDYVLKDIKAVTGICRDNGVISKIIIETALLTDNQKILACDLSREAGADFVKTSTGFSLGGATVEDVALMYSTVRRANMGVKASGGIRDYNQAMAMINAGAARIGTSSGVKIFEEAQRVEHQKKQS
jgi:deoxyribose-phosphate aldolase